MNPSRRRFLQLAGAGTLAGTGTLAAPLPLAPSPGERPLLKPPRLRTGATVGLISPGGVIGSRKDVDGVQQAMSDLGLRTKVGRHALDKRGYLAGTDPDRAADVNEMFADPEVDALLTLRGGWGCNRILPYLDYELIRANPKILLGYSDVTSLLIAVYARSGLVTFHGPVGISGWNRFTVDHVRRVLFNGVAAELRNPVWPGTNRTRAEHPVDTITPGTARGRLVGGNLTVVASMLGSAYLPDWEGHVLFLEDTEEGIYRIDRMLTQLSLAGVLPNLTGFVFGQCTDCEPDSDYGSLTLEEVFDDHVRPLGIPAWRGAMIGHISDKLTVPVGLPAEIDARSGTITLLEPAVH